MRIEARIAGEGEHGGRGSSHMPAYAELHCLSNFSFLRGASHPEELVARADELGYDALAITDRHSLAGVVRAHVAVKERQADARAQGREALRLIIGAEVWPVGGPPLVLLAPDRAAYARLSRLLTIGKLRTKKGACELCVRDLEQWGEGLVGIVLDEARSGSSIAEPWPENKLAGSVGDLLRYRRIFSRDALFLAAELSYEESDAERLTRLAELSEQTAIPLVACNNVHYHVPERRYLQDVLTCIREKCTLAEAGRRLHSNAERHLRPLDEIRRRYTSFSNRRLAEIGRAALKRTSDIARRCTFSLDDLRYDYPHEVVPGGLSAMDYLEQLTWRHAAEVYAQRRRVRDAGTEGTGRQKGKRRGDRGDETPWDLGIQQTGADASCRASPSISGRPNPQISQCADSAIPSTLLRHELALIRKLRYEHYFLTVYDIVRFARSRGILCQGRGSAANSAVCYVLGITAVDPTRHDLLFERFISCERNEPPDIDVDFEHERREEVFQYIYEKYGRERAAITAEVIRYRRRSAIRDVGKALGLSLDVVDVLAKHVEWFSDETLPADALRRLGVDPGDRTIRMLSRLVRQLQGFPRHLSQHVGGFVITETPLCEIVPLENGGMPGRTFIEWDKDDIDALGILKVDCLALGMLTAISKCFALLGSGDKARSAPLSLRTIPPEDPAVYDMICAADTIGVFQIESRAQMSMLPRLRPRNFYDLVIEVAIVRPGPIQGGMVHPYLRRRDGLEPVDYPSDAVKSVLHKTLGVPIFQEQVMRLAVVAAGFTPGEADQLRRSMAAWRRNGSIERFQEKLIRGMLANGYSKEFAEQIYRQVCGFGEYGFPESHAASFSLLVYASAWLKRYHPAAFLAAMLNSQPLGFYSPGQLIRDAIEHGVEVRPVDVSWSAWDCTLEESKGNGNRSQGARKWERRAGNADRKKRHAGEDRLAWGRDGPAVRLGFRMVRGLSSGKVRGILAARTTGVADVGAGRASPAASECSDAAIPQSVERPIRSLVQLTRRGDISCDTLLRLAAADAFRSLGLSRRAALWEILGSECGGFAKRERAERVRGERRSEARERDGKVTIGAQQASHAPRSLFAELEPQEPAATLPPPALDEVVSQDYETLGFSLHAHPMELVRSELDTLDLSEGVGRRRLRVIPNDRLRACRSRQRVAVAGLVTCRQRPGTAGGTVFMTLEDETARANLVIWKDVWKRYKHIARSCVALIAVGRVERKREVIHVMAERFYDLSAAIGALHHRSRDFH